MRRGHLEFRFVWPLTIIALAAMALLAATLVVGAHVVDLKVRQHEEHLVRRGLDGQLKEVELSLSAQTMWDEAVVRLDNRFDRKWAQQHIAAYLHQSIGTWDYMVVDSDGRPVWADHDVTPMPKGDWAAFRQQAGPIIARIRKQEQQRGPTVLILQTAAAKIPISKPIVASALELRNGRPYIWIASLVQSDFGAALPRKATSAIVVGGGELTPANIAAFQSRYDLKDVRLGVTPRTRRDGEAFTTFQPLSGPPLALIWTPNRPGADLLTGSIWVIGAVLLCFAALAGLMSRAARRSARALIDVHQAQAEFLANMSHEIRTPLNGVNALSEILAKTPLTAQQKGMVNTIHSSGVMLNRLLSDILDLARIDAGAMGVEAEPFDLGEAVRQVTSLMAPRAQEKGLELRLDLAPAAETSVIGDVTRLRQVLNNLVANAIKFTDAGYVSLTVRPEPGGDWRFEVCDTGIGFSAAQKERIFERFGQADPSVTRRFG